MRAELRRRDTPLLLLVEDNSSIRDAFALLLEESGYAVAQAGSGTEAIAVAEATLPDLVLMDVGLPDLDGLEVTRRLKANPRTRDTVVVALTGRALDADRAASVAAGCAGYLLKPIDSARLLAAIPEYLNMRGQDGDGERDSNARQAAEEPTGS